jgi:hypothetical protein
MKASSKLGLLLFALFPAHSTHAQVIELAPATHEQVEVAQKLIDRHFEIWNSSDSSKYRQSFAEIYSTDFFVADHDHVAKGYDAVVAMIRKVQSEHPGFKFTAKPIAINHGLGRVTWGYGPRDNPDLVTGEDIFMIDNDKISSTRVFLNKQ